MFKTRDRSLQRKAHPPENAWERARYWLQERPTLTVLLLVVAGSAIGGLAILVTGG